MKRIILVAIDIRSTHNVGALFRSCDGLGAELVLCGITPHPQRQTDDRLPHIVKKLEKDIDKTALGASTTVPWRYMANWKDTLAYLRSQDVSVVALEQTPAATKLNQSSINGDCALVVGPEVSGLADPILSACDACLEIPMIGQKESLNVSVAAALGLYELRRRDI